MAHCSDMKENQVWKCDKCGLEVKVEKQCSCGSEPSSADACGKEAALVCCGQPLQLKG